MKSDSKAPNRRPRDFKVGDKVMIKNAALKPKKDEVFELVEITVVSIKNDHGRVRSIHISNLKHAPK
jgi:hypothetical protein